MKFKRFLVSLLVAAMVLTSVGVPAMAVSSDQDAIPATWTTRDQLKEADQEITPQSNKGAFSEDGAAIAQKDSRYAADDMVTVIVELTGGTLLDAADGEIEAFASSQAGKRLADTIEATQNDVKAQIQALSGQASTASVNGSTTREFHYNTVFNGFSMTMRYGDLEAARKIDGVKRISVAEQYTLPTLQGEEYTPSMSSSGGMIGSDRANTLGYDGTGTIVAILDTGFMKDHEAFSVMPTDGKYQKDDIAKMLSQVKLASGVTDAEKVYVNEKAPYGYDYADGDTNAEAVGQAHGVHVAGTVAGNNGKDFFGVAPNAQLMIMKIFGDNSGSTGDDIILAGVDDAVKLGADSVNMSLGSPCGFAEYGDEDVEEGNGVLSYYGVYTRAEKAGVNVLVAAGNETSTSYYEPNGTELTLVEYPNNGIVATPSTVPATVSVASVDNVAYFKNHIQLADGSRFPYNDAADYNSQTTYDILQNLDGKTLDYVMIPGLGEEDDFEGLDLTGKVAVMVRGSLNFDVKAANAAKAGAVAAIIYNNAADGPFTAALTSYSIPVIGVSKEAGEAMANAETKTVGFSKDYYAKAVNPTGYQVSSFSSIGPSPVLGIKPEIAAPGGLIYSSVLGGGYEVYSGTSMATPHMAGEAALMKQYLQKTFPEKSAAEIGELATGLLMSTAIPSVDNGSGTYFSVRRQGAGVANVYNAIVSGAYLSVEGCNRPKAEVGSSKDGVYSYTVTVNNLNDVAKTYSVDTAALAETVALTADNQLRIANSMVKLTAEQVQITYTGLENGKIAVPANGKASFSVKIQLTEAGKKYYNDNFPNGCFIEGYTFLTAEHDNGVSMSVPFLGFFGDFYSLPLFDGAPNEKTNLLGTALADVDGSGVGNFLGMNGNLYNPEKMAYAPQRASRQLVARVSLLNCVTNFREYITDEAGNVVYDTGDLGWVRKTYGAATIQGIQYTAVVYTPGWNGRIHNEGEWAAEGQWYTYTIEGQAEGAAEKQTKSFRFFLDNTKPTISDVQLYEENGEVFLTCLVQDNFYLKRLWVVDSTQQYYYLTAEEEFAAVTEMGSATRVTFNVTELGDTLSKDGLNPGRVGLYLTDAAMNISTTWVDIGPQSVTLSPVTVGVGETQKVEASIKPARMADAKLIWASEDESIATVDENGVVTGIADGETRITATVALSGLKAYAKVTVGKGTPVYLHYGEAPELNDRFQTADGFSWKVIGPDEVQLISKASYGSYNDLSGDVVIPSTVEWSGKTFRVTSIGHQAFYFNSTIQSIVIPEGVTDVGYSAFFFAKVKHFTLPDSLTYVDTFAFSQGYSNKYTLNKIPSRIEWIGDSAFNYCQIETIDLPETLTHLGEKAFMGSSVESVTLPGSITEYGDCVFLDCENLSYVELPGNMKELPMGIFWNCTSLKRIQLPSGLEKIGNGSFYGSGLNRITIPSSVKVIDDWAFAWLTNMQTIDIPDTVEEIGFSAYIYCKGVKTVNIGSGVKTIGQDAFHTWNLELGEAPIMNVKSEDTATALRRSGYGQEILLNGVPYTGYNGVNFSDGKLAYMPTSDTEVQVISVLDGSDAELVIPETVYCEGDDRTYTVTSVRDRVFFQNQSIQKLTIPDTVTDLGERAFDQMYNVTDVTISKNLKNVGYQALGYLGWFCHANGLTFTPGQTLYVPGSVEFMDQCAFAGNRHDAIVVGEGVTELSNYAFHSCKEAKSVTLPSTLKRIGNAALESCSSLTSIQLPEGLTYIGDGAFSAVPLEAITLPEGLEYLGRNSLGVYSYNADYTAKQWYGPSHIELNGSLKKMGYDALRGDATIVTRLNSQKNMVVKYMNRMDKMPVVIWDGKTDIPFNDGSTIPYGTTVTVSKDVRIDGKLVVEGELAFENGAQLIVGDDGIVEYNNKEFQITSQPESVALEANQNATFTVKTNRDTVATYQWQYSNNQGKTWTNSGAEGAQEASLTVTMYRYRDGQMYRCIVTDDQGNRLTSEAATMTLLDYAPKLVEQPASVTAKSGETATFRVKATGENLTYQWYFSNNGGQSWGKSSGEGAQTDTLQVAAMRYRSGQMYRCVVTNAYGRVTSEAAALTVE